MATAEWRASHPSPDIPAKRGKALAVWVAHAAKIQFGLIAQADKKLAVAESGAMREIESVPSTCRK